MKKLLLIAAFVLMGFGAAFAQAPQQFNYQGAARNANGSPLANKPISLRISILNGSATGSAQYAETRNVTTNLLGLYSVIIGSSGAITTSGSMAAVTWQSGLKYIKVEVDVNNGTNFSVAGTAQLLSVPYALYAANSPAGTPGAVGPTGPQGATGKGIASIVNSGDGTLTVTYTDGTNFITSSLTGPVGPQGATGLAGATGAQGLAGATGLTGAAGTNGIDGAKGDVGAQGLQGIAGLNGAAGAQGLQGLQGEKGETGMQGSQGVQGIAGLTGSQGLQGLQGLTGPIGPQGGIGLIEAGINTTVSGTGVTGDAYKINTTIVSTDASNLITAGADGGAKLLATSLSVITADNGLTKTANNVQLGGALIKPTILTTDATNTLALAGLKTGAATDNIVVADATGVLKTIAPAILAVEPWNKRLTTINATANTDNIYQTGNVAIGTQNGLGTFNIDAAKDNPATGTPSSTNVLDDIIVTPGGRVGFGYSPSDAVFSGNAFDDKITFQANGDLDFNYSLATGTSNAQAIVHRNIISNGTIGARTARPNGTSIVAFEGHTTTGSASYGLTSAVTQQRAGVVLRTGKENAYGGEIWFGTSGASQDDGGKSLTTVAGNIYRAVIDQRGKWALGADPNHDAYYRNPTERLDLILGGVRIGALGYGTLAAWRTAEAAERPNYISTDPNDRVVVADANGVLKTIGSATLSKTNIIKTTVDYTVLATDYTILANATTAGLTLTLPTASGNTGRILVIRKTDETANALTLSVAVKVSETTSITTLNINSTIRIQSDGTDWYKID